MQSPVVAAARGEQSGGGSSSSSSHACTARVCEGGGLLQCAGQIHSHHAAIEAANDSPPSKMSRGTEFRARRLFSAPIRSPSGEALKGQLVTGRFDAGEKHETEDDTPASTGDVHSGARRRSTSASSVTVVSSLRHSLFGGAGARPAGDGRRASSHGRRMSFKSMLGGTRPDSGRGRDGGGVAAFAADGSGDSFGRVGGAASGDACTNGAGGDRFLNGDSSSHRYQMMALAAGDPTMPTAFASSSGEEEETASLRKEIYHLNHELDRQIGQRRRLQDELSSERSRNDALTKHNKELLQVYEDKLLGHQRVTCAETEELSSQVETLLHIKRQLFSRVQELESERAKLLAERQLSIKDRACVVCMDRLANTVLFRCKHLVCCDVCGLRLSHCPVCRQAVRDRLTVFVCC